MSVNKSNEKLVNMFIVKRYYLKLLNSFLTNTLSTLVSSSFGANLAYKFLDPLGICK